MRIRVDAFSGRPSPWWKLTHSECDELVERVCDMPSDLQDSREPVLGLRGFDVMADGNDRVPARLPASFRLPIYDSSGDTIEWLLATSRCVVHDEALDALSESAKQPATRSKAKGARVAKTLAADLDAVQCHPFLTAKRLAFWNRLWVQPNNNCYNYSSNFVSNTLAQPGRRTGQMYSSFSCQSVADAALADGYSDVCNGSMRVVALAIWPGVDFHWWRLHPNGFWSHKIGWQPASDRDNSLRIIGGGLNPHNCDRGPYTQFCGYYFAPLNMGVL